MIQGLYLSQANFKIQKQDIAIFWINQIIFKIIQLLHWLR